MKAYLKWAGSKKQLVPELKPIITAKLKEGSKFIEPFVGGGSVFLALEPEKVIINDCNSELINTYEVVKDSPDELIAELKTHKENHCEEYYYRIRNMDREADYPDLSPVSKAARFIYLNRTCFNGLYRVNKSGYYNVPIGR